MPEESKNSQQAFLSPEQQRLVIQQVVENNQKGRLARQEKEEIWQRCWRSYHSYVDKALYRKQPWRSKLHLPWTFQAVEAGATELQDLLLPNNEDFFAIQPITPDDSQNAEVMTRYLQFLFRQMGFSEAFSNFLKQLCVTGNSVLKVFWKQESCQVNQRALEPASGQMMVSETTEETLYDAPCIETLDLQDFVFFPATGNLNRAMCIHRLVRDVEELHKHPLYRNTDKLQEPGRALDSPTNPLFGIHPQRDSEDGIELLEAWGDFHIQGKTYRNYVATVANQSTLIRFQPNPYDYGMKPFVFASMIPVPGQIYGIGIVEPALGLQSMANTISNILLDEMKLKLNGQWKYEEDGVFNPNQFVSRPGGTIKVGSLENLVPLQPNLHLDVGFVELNNLKAEFEETTGVNKYSKGADTLNKTRTAQEAMMLQQAGSRKFTRIAKHLNDAALTQAIALVYQMVRQFANPEEIARITNVSLEEINLSIPLSSLDFKITGLQTSLLKQQNIENTERFVTGLAATPAAQYIRWDLLAQRYYQLLGFENAQEILQQPPEHESNAQIQQPLNLNPLNLNSPDYPIY